MCRKMKDSGKHRFHSLEHDSKMRLFKTYSHTSTLRGKKASGKTLNQKTTNEEHKTEKVVQNTAANGGIDTREIYHFPQISEGNGAREKGKREICTENRTKKNAKTLGSKAEESKTSRSKPQAVAKKAYQNAIRTKPNSRARNGHRSSPSGGDVETGRRITRKIPPGKLNQKRRQNECPAKNQNSKFKSGKTGSNKLGQWWPVA